MLNQTPVLNPESMQAHGGQVEVDSRVGQGSVFAVRLPVHGGVKAVGSAGTAPP